MRPELVALAVLLILNVVLVGALLFRSAREQAVIATSAGEPSPPIERATASPSRSSEAPEPDSSKPSGTPTTSATAGSKGPNSPDPAEPKIELAEPPSSAKPFELVEINGTYRGGPNTMVRVQRREKGKWPSFPLPATTDASGDFTAYLEFGRPGRYRLRVVDPDSKVESEPFVLVVKS